VFSQISCFGAKNKAKFVILTKQNDLISATNSSFAHRFPVLRDRGKNLMALSEFYRSAHRLIYSMLDAVPPIHAESSHVATDMDPSK